MAKFIMFRFYEYDEYKMAKFIMSNVIYPKSTKIDSFKQKNEDVTARIPY